MEFCGFSPNLAAECAQPCRTAQRMLWRCACIHFGLRPDLESVISQESAAAWWEITAQETAQRLATDLAAGLSAEEAVKRAAVYGPNSIKEGRSRGPWRIFAAQFADFMIVVLLAAGVLAGFLGEPADTAAILAIVILNAVIGFTQEYRAERAITALRRMAAPQARALRSGEAVTIPAAGLVPGDIVLMEAGNLVPADLRICEAAELTIDESSLTGESQPVEKSISPVTANPPEGLSLGDRTCVAYKGTIVTHGRGRGIITASGMDTELGRIAGLLDRPTDIRTPLQKRLAQFGKYLAMGALAICAIIFAAGLQSGVPLVRMFLTAVSLAVAAIPEALPAVVTIALALGARRMLRAHTLVRRLPAVETLGSVTYICSDKTGTLTQNRMRLTSIYADGKEFADWQGVGNGEPWKTLFTALALNNDATGNGYGDPTEVALLEAAAQAGYDRTVLQQSLPRVAEEAFNSARRRMTTLHRSAGAAMAFTKGAPEAVLPHCAKALHSSGEVVFDQPAMNAVAGRMAAGGLRVMAIAYRRFLSVPSLPVPSGAELENPGEPGTAANPLVFLGLVGLMDPPRKEAQDAVAVCRQAGIVPVMITGDHPATAQAIAGQLGILAAGGVVMTGAELERLSAAELEIQVMTVRVYARVDPAQKLRIVEALQKRGEFVAMTGDGVNDAPALQQADIGIAMGKGGTDVARQAADLVLLDDNFATIVAATREGRHIYDNIRKFVSFVMSSNSAEIWTIFLAPMLGLPVPLLPIHILWINLVTDGLPGLALTSEPQEGSIMRRPPRPPSESLFAGGLWQHVVWVGLLIAGLSLFSQAYAMQTGSAHWQTMIFTVLTLSQMANVMTARSEVESFWSLGLFTNLPLLGAVTLTFVMQMAAIYFPPLQRILRTAPLSASELAFALGLCALVFIAVEIEKWLIRKRWIYANR